MTTETTTPSQGIPSIVNILNPLVRRLLRIGMPMGPNALLTVRGRTSGEPRTFPVAILETGGRSYVFSAFGEANWVRNLRASGEGTLKRGRRSAPVMAVELAPDEAAPIMRAAFSSFLKVRAFAPILGGWYGLSASSTAADYLVSALAHPGFELRPAG